MRAASSWMDWCRGWRGRVAAIGTAEKGYLDVALTTRGAGGHSSEPPDHTAIGELSAGLTRLEKDQFPASMPSVVEDQYGLLAPYLPFSKRLVLGNLWLFKPLVVRTELKNPLRAGSYRTTTAETMISGGFKENALPTSARASINFRILPGESVESVLGRVRKVVDDPGITVADANPGSSRNPCVPSPIDSTGYRTLSTTIQQVFPDAVIVPNLLNAATDSSYYTALSPNVYRFLAVETDSSALTMVHGLNERIAPEKYVKTVQFTAQLIRNIR